MCGKMFKIKRKKALKVTLKIQKISYCVIFVTSMTFINERPSYTSGRVSYTCTIIKYFPNFILTRF